MFQRNVTDAFFPSANCTGTQSRSAGSFLLEKFTLGAQSIYLMLLERFSLVFQTIFCVNMRFVIMDEVSYNCSSYLISMVGVLSCVVVMNEGCWHYWVFGGVLTNPLC